MAMSTPAVRAIRPEDEDAAAEVARLATADLRRVYWPTPIAVQHRATLAAQLHRLVAVVDRRIVGVVQYYVAGDRLAFLGLGVHPEYRRRGVAKALVRQLEQIGRECGCTTLTLNTVRQTGNVEVFHRLGFFVESEAPTGLFEGVGNMSLSEVAMRKGLAGLDSTPDSTDGALER